MPTLRSNMKSRSGKAQENNANGARGSYNPPNGVPPTTQSDGTDENDALTATTAKTSNSPSKRRARRGGMGASSPKKLAGAKSATDDASPPPPPASTTSSIISPSPHKVVSDLIDATCHEILLLGGRDPETVSPYASYAFLAERLDYYMECLLDRGNERFGEEEGGGRRRRRRRRKQLQGMVLVTNPS